jgi:hypothetical protein
MSGFQVITAEQSQFVRVAGTEGSRLRIHNSLTTHHGRVGRGCIVGRGLGDGLGEELSQLGAQALPSL